MRICVIFNPAARGNKARHFRHHLSEIGGQSALKATAAAGDARRLAADAVKDGFDVIVAAGGDGTVHEVLNGIGDAPGGFEKARLGVLPLGTVNVFARELNMPLKMEKAWEHLLRGQERKIDLPYAEFLATGKKVYFVQLGGAGLDVRAIELVDFSVKKKIGPLAYVIAGLKALFEKKLQIKATANGSSYSGELVLVGNGKYYGGPFEVFPSADLCDGILDVCIFPRTDMGTLLRCAPDFLFRRKLPEKLVKRFRGPGFELAADLAASLELDGELVGALPVRFGVEQGRLRVMG
ncbi:MAG TPA: diacylglycerol kinase family protein [Verrucomicrobiae bacterium]